MITFIPYDDARPILEEYQPSLALKILFEKHQEFPEHYIEAMVTSAELCLTETDPQFLYLTYINAVVQMRWDVKELQETYSF